MQTNQRRVAPYKKVLHNVEPVRLLTRCSWMYFQMLQTFGLDQGCLVYWYALRIRTYDLRTLRDLYLHCFHAITAVCSSRLVLSFVGAGLSSLCSELGDLGRCSGSACHFAGSVLSSEAVLDV